MSVRRHLSLVCDRCSETLTATSGGARRLRNYAHTIGWQIRWRPNRTMMDVCPRCTGSPPYPAPPAILDAP